MSSAAAIGVAASGFGSEVARAAGFSAPRPFSVAFLDGDHLISADNLRHDLDTDVARIQIDGFWSTDATPRSAAIAAYFPHRGHDIPFLAWGHVHQPNVIPPRAAFRLPVHDGSLALGFESRDPLPAPKTDLTRRLAQVRSQITGPSADALVVATTDREASARYSLKARRGTYVVAFRDKASDPKPDWRSLELRAGNKPLGNVKFDYLVFMVDRV